MKINPKIFLEEIDVLVLERYELPQDLDSVVEIYKILYECDNYFFEKFLKKIFFSFNQALLVCHT